MARESVAGGLEKTRNDHSAAVGRSQMKNEKRTMKSEWALPVIGDSIRCVYGTANGKTFAKEQEIG